jgi:hypothetical protein
MFPRTNRRQFLRTTLAGATGLALPSISSLAADTEAFSFVLLGDLHFDKLEHHDLAWIEKNKGGDLGQIRNYSRITAEIMPQLFATVRETIAELNRTPKTRVAFVLQVGDLVEGLCGTEALAAQQNREALDFVQAAKLGVPFLVTKGNHDVTGDGAVAAFNGVLLPYLRDQAKSFPSRVTPTGASYAMEHGGVFLGCFDAYEPASLDWLEAALAQRTAPHCMVTIHPPVVPYGARATWHLYAREKDRTRREKLLYLLGRNNAYVLGGHIHKFNTLTRRTPDGGKFAQLAVSSVVGALEMIPKAVLAGIAEYNGDQIRVEPAHSPATEKDRDQITAKIFSGVSRQLWKTVDLTKTING